MAASLIVMRTKPTAVPDPDPRLGVFVPPSAEIFKPSLQAKGVRIGLVYTAAGFTATVYVYAQDATTKSWFLAKAQGTLGGRTLVTECASGAHDVWVGLADITGGVPVKVYVEEVS